MKKLIATHGKLSTGLKSSLEVILGSIKDLDIITAYVENIDLKKEFLKFKNNLLEDEKCIVFTDLEGGSVNQFIANNKTENMIIVTGINLSFLLEYLANETDNEEEIQNIINETRKELKIVKLEKYKDDFDF